jgi:hypothetical protein
MRMNKKAAFEIFVKILLWILFFVILIAGISFLIKSLTGGI